MSAALRAEDSTPVLDGLVRGSAQEPTSRSALLVDGSQLSSMKNMRKTFFVELLTNWMNRRCLFYYGFAHAKIGSAGMASAPQVDTLKAPSFATRLIETFRIVSHFSSELYSCSL